MPLRLYVIEAPGTLVLACGCFGYLGVVLDCGRRDVATDGNLSGVSESEGHCSLAFHAAFTPQNSYLTFLKAFHSYSVQLTTLLLEAWLCMFNRANELNSL